MKLIYGIFKKYKYQLTWIYLFMVLTEISNLFTPFLLGRSIDGLLNGTHHWLILLGISYFMSNFFNYKRMVYDTKVYTKIYNDVVLNFLKTSKENTSTKIARTDMGHDIVNVLEGYVHYYIATIITVIGSIGIIFSENTMVGYLVTIAAIVMFLSVLVYYKKIRQGQRIMYNHYENKATAINEGYEKSKSFFLRRRKLEIYQSNLQGKNWFLVGVIKNTFLFLSIVLLIKTSENVTIGSVITTYSYINNFMVALFSIPVATEMYYRLKDVLRRVV